MKVSKEIWDSVEIGNSIDNLVLKLANHLLEGKDKKLQV